MSTAIAEEVYLEAQVKLREPKKDSKRAREGGLEHAPFRLWLPAGVKTIRGVSFNPYYTKAVTQQHWQAACRQWGFGILAANFFGVKSDEIPTMVNTALATFAKESGGAVSIFAEVEAPGTYRFSLRRWPEEMNEPIRAAAGLTVPDGFTGASKREKGKALPIVKARLKVAGFDKTIEVTDDMSEATFTVPLKKGACDVHAQFIDDDGKAYGAYFLYVKREGQRKQQ